MWIRLTLSHSTRDDKVVRINLDNVCAYWCGEEEHTIVQLSGSDDNYIVVEETPYEIDVKVHGGGQYRM